MTIETCLFLVKWLPVRQMLLGFCLAVSAVGVMAALGQAPSVPAATAASPTVPAAKLSANKQVVTNSLYSVQEIQLENGTLVREYVDLAGQVFAVSWRGPVLPNLSELLGGYFSSFKQEVDLARARGSRGSSVHVQRSDLVLRSSGRMRNFYGHAYAPALVPAGITIQDVLP